MTIVRIGFLVLSRVVSTLNVSISIVLFSSAAEAAATGTKAYIESSRFTGVSLVGTNDRSNSYAETGGVEASSIRSLSASGTSVSGTNDTSLRISSACEGVTWLAVVLGNNRLDGTDYRRPDSGPEVVHFYYNGGQPLK